MDINLFQSLMEQREGLEEQADALTKQIESFIEPYVALIHTDGEDEALGGVLINHVWAEGDDGSYCIGLAESYDKSYVAYFKEQLLKRVREEAEAKAAHKEAQEREQLAKLKAKYESAA